MSTAMAVLFLLLPLASGERAEEAASRALLQRFSLNSKTKATEERLDLWQPTPGDLENLVRVNASVAPSRMHVLAMLLLMCLLCALVDGIGCFLSHAMKLIWDGEPSSVRQPDLGGLAFLRLLGAVHLVMYSYGPSWCSGFNAWGASWFSLYFILSGLSSAQKKLSFGPSGSDWLPQRDLLLKHWALVYPLYLLSLGWVLLNTYLLKGVQAPRLLDLAFEALMLPEGLLPQRLLYKINGPNAFFSALAFCWLLEEALFTLGSRAWESGRFCQRGAFVAVVLWTAIWPFAAPGTLVSLEDNVPALSFIHCYFCGVLLAHSLHDAQGLAARSSAISASGALLIMVAIFVGIGDASMVANWAQFVLLPLQCMLIYSLGRGQDPVARIFGTWPLPLVSELALGIYIFQAPGKQLLDALMGWQGPIGDAWPLKNLRQLSVLLVFLALLALLAQQLQRRLALATKALLA
ncbi:unnamed protein product [Effrenium voratum]|nr:unnamed protein product [Effrenium voratum]